MVEIVLRPFKEADFAIIRAWYQDEGSKLWLGGKLSLKGWFRYIWQRPNYYTWMACEGNRAVGMVELEAHGALFGTAGLLVNPANRRQGYGQRILKAMLAQPEARAIKAITAKIERENTASLRCFKAVGFIDDNEEWPQEKVRTLYYWREG